MAYSIVTPIAGYQGLAVTETSQKHPLGTVVTAVDPTFGQGEFVYLKGIASTVVGSVAALDQNAGTTTLVLAATRGPVGVAMSINVANQYGWYQVSGVAAVKANTVVAQTSAFSTAVAGITDDAVVAGSRIDGMVYKTADGTPSAGLAQAQISRPSMNNAG